MVCERFKPVGRVVLVGGKEAQVGGTGRSFDDAFDVALDDSTPEPSRDLDSIPFGSNVEFDIDIADGTIPKRIV